MIKEAVLSYIVKKSLDFTIDLTAKLFKVKKSLFLSNHKEVIEKLQIHVHDVNNWSTEISFKDLQKAKYTSDVYIELDVFLIPNKIAFSNEENSTIKFMTIFEKYENRHLVITGQPGAGKTTLMKSICNAIIIDENKFNDKSAFPILIRLREFNKLYKADYKMPLVTHLFNLLGIQLVLPVDVEEDVKLPLKESFLINFLDQLNVVVIFDGYDEISSYGLKHSVIEDFRKLCINLRQSKLILTSRGSDYNFHIDKSTVFEIAPLNNSQIIDFSNKWLGDSEKAEELLSKIKISPFYDAAIRPLTLAHLCAIFERSGNIPDKPKTMYRKIVNLLLEEWDEQRSIQRPSKYANFEIDRKFEFLSRMAYEITTSLNKNIFNKQELIGIYKYICEDFDLSIHDSQFVINEIESHTGLLYQSGYDNFEFAHKSIQEFLTAEYIVKLPSLSKIHGLRYIPNELAIAVAISSLPSDYFFELINLTFKGVELTENFINVFVNRLILEKPDFNQSDEVRIALLSLYTQFILGKGGQLKLFHSDLPLLFNNFVKHIMRKSSSSSIKKHYDIVEEELYGGDFIKLIVKDKFRGTFPKLLVAKMEFLENNVNHTDSSL